MGFVYSKPPCKECEDRHSKCHSQCSEYRDWSNSRKEVEVKARKKYETEKEMVDYFFTGLKKGTRRKRKGR